MFDVAIRSLESETEAVKASRNKKFVLGILYLDRERYAQAKQQFEEAIKLQPDNADAYFYLGITYRLEGNVGQFIKSMEKTLDLNQKYVQAYNELAIHYAFHDSAKRFEKAREILDQARSQIPNEESIYVNQAILYWTYVNLASKERKSEYIDSVISNLKVATKIRPREQSYFLLGLAHWVKHEYMFARTAMGKAVEFNPQNINALLVIADTYKSMKDYERALEFAEKARAIKPSNKEVEIFIDELKAYRKRT